MSDQARIDSIDVIREFRAELFKFGEAGKVALGDAESDLRRTLMWLDTEMAAYWGGQIKKRAELLGRAAEKLNEKRAFKDAFGRPQSVVDEEKAFRLAKARLEEAQAKAAAVKRYVRVLQKASDDFKGAVQGFATCVAHDVPAAAARLDRLGGLLNQYVALSPAGAADAGADAAAAPGAGAGGMTRPADAAPADGAGADDDLPDFPAVAAPTVVLVHTHRPTGLVLAAGGKAPAGGDGDQYKLFADRAAAEQYAAAAVAANPDVECAVYGPDRARLAVAAK